MDAGSERAGYLAFSEYLKPRQPAGLHPDRHRQSGTVWFRDKRRAVHSAAAERSHTNATVPPARHPRPIRPNPCGSVEVDEQQFFGTCVRHWRTAHDRDHRAGVSGWLCSRAARAFMPVGLGRAGRLAWVQVPVVRAGVHRSDRCRGSARARSLDHPRRSGRRRLGLSLG